MLTITTGHLSPSMDPTICTGSHHTGRQTSRQRMFHQHHDANKPHTRRTPGHKPNPFDLHSGNRDNQAPPRAHTRLRSSRATKQLGALAYVYSCTGASSTLTAHKNLATYHHAAVTQNQTAARTTTSRQRSCHPSVVNTTPQNTVTGSTTTTAATYNRIISPTQGHKPLTTI